MNKRHLAGLFLALAAFSAHADMTLGERKSDDVLYRIRASDCKGAVEHLNDGLARAWPEVFLLAGTMFENGICVRKDWNKAVHFYVRASDAGKRAAALRLASGFAAPEHGPDVAAALWWATRPQVGWQANSCGVSAEAANDPDKFVAELKTWPESRLKQCNYIAGVMTTLSGELRYPDKALNYNLGGKFTVRFLPAEPRIYVSSGETHAYQPVGLASGDMLRDREAGSLDKAFKEELDQIAGRALKRYPQPAGFSPESSIDMDFDFHIE